jgi:hypothetical protein
MDQQDMAHLIHRSRICDLRQPKRRRIMDICLKKRTHMAPTQHLDPATLAHL